jgi:hypothetical protein
MDQRWSVSVNPALITNSMLTGVASPDVPAFANLKSQARECQGPINLPGHAYLPGTGSVNKDPIDCFAGGAAA